MNKPVTIAVFPVAGLGTRILPATKVMPKEMLPLLDKPLIQHAVEECLAAGINRFVFVISKGKEILVDHFRPAPELTRLLAARNKSDLLSVVQSATLAPDQIQIAYQDEALGLGHAVWCAREAVGNNPFAVLLPDDVFLGTPCLPEMMEAYEKVGGNLAAVMDVPRSETARYGILDVVGENGQLVAAQGLVEKPAPEKAPSTLSIIGRYILQPEIFAALSAFEKGAGGEIQLTDAMAKLIGPQPFHGFRFSGTRYDCGTKFGLIASNLAFALADRDIGVATRDLIQTLAKKA